jgi:sulfite exporter TauE/SafE
MLAAFSGSAQGGALSMLAFGLGTLPAMMAASLTGSSLRAQLQSRPIRMSAGAVVMLLGLYMLSQLAGGPQALWANLCGGHTP